MMKYFTTTLLICLTPVFIFAEDDSRLLDNLQQQLQELETEAQQELRRYNNHWFLSRHNLCNEIPEDNFDEIISCRQVIDNIYNTVIQNEHERSQRVNLIEQKIDQVEEAVSLKDELSGVNTGSESSRNRAIELHERRSELFRNRSEWQQFAGDDDPLMMAARELGSAAVLAAQNGDAETLERLLNEQHETHPEYNFTEQEDIDQLAAMMDAFAEAGNAFPSGLALRANQIYDALPDSDARKAQVDEIRSRMRD